MSPNTGRWRQSLLPPSARRGRGRQATQTRTPRSHSQRSGSFDVGSLHSPARRLSARRDQARSDAKPPAGFETLSPKSFIGLADSENAVKSQPVRVQPTGAALRLRYSLDVTPVVALKARLNGPSDWKPASMAMVMTGTSACAGSASAVLASSIRWLLRKTLKLR